MNIYGEILIENWRNPKNYKKVSKPTHSAEVYNPLCGDKIKIEVKIRSDEIVDIGFRGGGCIISQAAASLLTQEVRKLKNVKRVKNLTERKVFELIGTEIRTARRKCALLPLEVLRKALK